MGFPASTTMGGVCFAFPDVCKVPAPPAPPIPTPFPNIAQCAMAVSTTVVVKIMNMPAITTSSQIPMSNGDEAGVAGGVTSGVFMQACAFKVGSVIVKFEGNPAFTALKMTTHNGSSPNNPAGSQIAPSQAMVLVGG